jgi:hypothetical protein
LLEAALVVPLGVFLCLGTLQLLCLEHGKLLTEYAAYQAARAGAVWNGSYPRMRDAAFFALLPALGKTGTLEEIAATSVEAQRVDQQLGRAGLGVPQGDLPLGFNRDALAGQLRVDTLSPALYPALGKNWRVSGQDAWQELDFDGADGFPEAPEAERHFQAAMAGATGDPAEQDLRSATRLTLRVRFFYELKVPFANRLVFLCWYAARARARLFGAIDRPSVAPASLTANGAGVAALQGKAQALTHAAGFASVSPRDLDLLWTLAMEGLPGVGRRVLLPLTATHTMRLQSNFYRKWVMHARPTWEP